MVWFPEQTDFRISGFRISMFGDGRVEVPPVQTATRTDLWHHWLRTSIEHAAEAEQHAQVAREAKAADQNEAAGAAVANECRAGMVAAAGAAFAVDGLYAAIKERIRVPGGLVASWRKNRTARPVQVLEVFKLGCDVGNRERKLDHAIRTIFRFRDWSAHPPAAFREPVLRQDLHVGVPWQYVAFAAGNAKQLSEAALNVATFCVWHPKLIWPDLVVWGESKRRLVDEFRISACLGPYKEG